MIYLHKTSPKSQFVLTSVCFLIMGILSACQTRVPDPIPSQTPTFLAETPKVSQTPSPSLTPTPDPTFTPTHASFTAVCSPLKSISLAELPSITSNKFDFQSSFSDTGHPAVDLAFFTFKEFSTFLGHPVQALLPGRVVQVVDDRFPYGNMIMIETPLEWISSGLLESLQLPTPIPSENIHRFSTCSNEMEPISWNRDLKSLYTVYAHLEGDLLVKIGEMISCGQEIGAVGLSGNTVAEHLHIEMRLGPADAQFGSIATYTDAATPQERYNYCIWSLSGLFQAIDPSLFWISEP